MMMMNKGIYDNTLCQAKLAKQCSSCLSFFFLMPLLMCHAELLKQLLVLESHLATSNKKNMRLYLYVACLKDCLRQRNIKNVFEHLPRVLNTLDGSAG